MNKLYNFLIEAKKQAYANPNIKKAEPLRPGSQDYHYENDEMIYHDTYFGSNNFMGEEVVYDRNNTPIWGMNYYGATFDEALSVEIFSKVLRPALMNVGTDNDIIPVRGPKQYISGEYEYTFTVKGTLDNFDGIEIIYKNKEKVYELKCHGGIIKK